MAAEVSGQIGAGRGRASAADVCARQYDVDKRRSMGVWFGSGVPAISEFAEVFMRQLNFPKNFFRGVKTVYSKVAAQGRSRLTHRSKDADAPHMFDSGLSVVGDWILDLSVLALIVLVVGNVLKWAYVVIFHR
jgi:hypothetical protein